MKAQKASPFTPYIVAWNYAIAYYFLIPYYSSLEILEGQGIELVVLSVILPVLLVIIFAMTLVAKIMDNLSEKRKTTCLGHKLHSEIRVQRTCREANKILWSLNSGHIIGALKFLFLGKGMKREDQDNIPCPITPIIQVERDSSIGNPDPFTKKYPNLNIKCKIANDPNRRCKCIGS